MAQCSVDDCDRPVVSRGYCSKHYRRWLKTGDPLRTLIAAPGALTDEERFWRFVDQCGPPDACWPWTGSVTKKGYPYFTRTSTQPRTVRAHRWAYELVVGPIVDDLDHDCHSRAVRSGACAGGPTCPHRRCCNPAHLIPTERGANVLLGLTIPAGNAAKTKCDRGHPFTAENTRVDPKTGHRACRTCARENVAAWRERDRPRCSIEGCDKFVAARGWCKMHWYRWRRHDDPLVVVRSRSA